MRRSTFAVIPALAIGFGGLAAGAGAFQDSTPGAGRAGAEADLGGPRRRGGPPPRRFYPAVRGGNRGAVVTGVGERRGGRVDGRGAEPEEDDLSVAAERQRLGDPRRQKDRPAAGNGDLGAGVSPWMARGRATPPATTKNVRSPPSTTASTGPAKPGTHPPARAAKRPRVTSLCPPAARRRPPRRGQRTRRRRRRRGRRPPYPRRLTTECAIRVRRPATAGRPAAAGREEGRARPRIVADMPSMAAPDETAWPRDRTRGG